MILITGASKGIGKYLFERFVTRHDVYGTYSNTEPPKEYLDYYFKVDVRDINSVRKWVNSLENIHQAVLINCAGINYNSFAHKADVDKWKNVIDVNLTGVFNIIHEILPFMRNDNYGRIINMSSVVSQTGILGTSAYAASKSGLNGMIKSIAKENGSKNITINNLNLGYFDIGIIREVPDGMKEKIRKEIPNHQFGDPMVIYNIIQLIIETPYINGTSVEINGGLY